jgi:hypothetical protein
LFCYNSLPRLGYWCWVYILKLSYYYLLYIMSLCVFWSTYLLSCLHTILWLNIAADDMLSRLVSIYM